MERLKPLKQGYWWKGIHKRKVWLSSQFDMKDLGEANFILGIKLWRDCKNKMLGLSQAGYIDKVLERFSMQNSKKWLLPFRHGVPLSDDQRPKTQEEEDMMRQIPYASTVGSLMYAMLCTRPDICYSVGIVSRYQSNPGPKHWQAVKHILKYLQKTRDYMLVYRCVHSYYNFPLRTLIFPSLLIFGFEFHRTKIRSLVLKF